MLANDRLTPPVHVLAIMAVGLVTVLPSYYIADMESFRPTRALGPVFWLQPDNRSAATGQKSVPEAPKLQAQTACEPPHGNSSEEVGADKAAVAAVSAIKNTDVSHLYGEAHLTKFFRVLKERTQGPVRVLHYGDSTLAGDGIAKTVRARMQARFGNGGPGFFVASMDPRWMRRDDVRVDRTGDWNVQTILFGGNSGRYGLGGVVAKPNGKSQILVSPPTPKLSMGEHVELYTQKSRCDEKPVFEINGKKIDSVKRVEHQAFDQWIIEGTDPVKRVTITVTEPNLEVYGAVIEAARGITWETAAVVGIASGSIRHFDPVHLAEQTAARNPDLIVIMLGGNETNHGGLMTPEGRIYKEGFAAALNVLRQGAPKAACLVMSPLDQGMLNDDGRVTSRPLLERMVTYQRQVSLDNGCAFWDTWQFMGGRDSFARWLSQGLAWTDLNHLTERGLQRIGNAFSDALLQSQQRFEAGQ